MPIKPSSRIFPAPFDHSRSQKIGANYQSKRAITFLAVVAIMCTNWLFFHNTAFAQEKIITTVDTLNKNLMDDAKYGKGGHKVIVIYDNIYKRDSVVYYEDPKKRTRELHRTTIIKDEGLTYYTAQFNKYKDILAKPDAEKQLMAKDDLNNYLHFYSEFCVSLGIYGPPKTLKDVDISLMQKIEEDSYTDFDASGNAYKTSNKTVVHDALGNIIYTNTENSELKNAHEYLYQKQLIYYVDSDRKPHNKRYNSKTKDWEDISLTSLPGNNQIGLDQGANKLPESNQASLPAPIDASNILFPKNEAFVGIAYMNIANSGQGNSGYGSLGAVGEYTRFITPHWGATANFGVYLHKETQDDYTQSFTQFNITAGPTFIPCKDPWNDSKKFTGYVHLLLGLSD